MMTSDSALQQIAEWEGIKFKMYLCAANKPTIGVGHLIKEDEQHLMTATLNNSQVMQLFRDDIKETVGYVTNHFKGVELTQKQFDAAVSFCFNAGIGNLRKAQWAGLLKEGKIEEAAKSLAAWGNKQWKSAPGLERRRFIESRWLKA